MNAIYAFMLNFVCEKKKKMSEAIANVLTAWRRGFIFADWGFL